MRLLTGVVLLVWSFYPATGLRAQVRRDPPVVLPKVKVPANVPLVKVAEFTMPEERYQPAAVSSGDFIYIIGGSTEDGSLLDSVLRFNVRTGKFEEFAQLRIARRGHHAAIIEGRLYVLGGYSVQGLTTGSAVATQALTMNGAAPGKSPFDVTVTPRHDLFNEAANNPNIPPSPEAMDRAMRTLAMVGSSISQVIEFKALEESMEVIDLATRKVSFAPEMPEPRARFACVARGGKIFVVGGQRPYRHVETARTNTTLLFDPATAKWTVGVPMPTPRETEGVLVDGGVVVVAGGYNGLVPLSQVEVFNPKDGIWRILPPLCRPTSAHSMVFLDHYLFLFGDYASPGELLAYDLEKKQSEVFTLQYIPSRHTAAVVNDGKIYVIGGRASSATDVLNYIQVFELRKKT